MVAADTPKGEQEEDDGWVKSNPGKAKFPTCESVWVPPYIGLLSRENPDGIPGTCCRSSEPNAVVGK